MADAPSSAGEPAKPPSEESTAPVENSGPAPPPTPASPPAPPASPDLSSPSDSPAPPPPPAPTTPSPAPSPPASERKPPQTSTAPPLGKTSAPAPDTKFSLSSSSVSSNGTARSTGGSSSTSSATTSIAGLTNGPGAADGGAATSNPGLDSGAVAGIALGTVVFGFVLGVLAAMFFFRRKHRSAYSEDKASSPSQWRWTKVVDHIDVRDAVRTSKAPVTKATPARRRSFSSSSIPILSPLDAMVRAASAQAIHSTTSGAASPEPLQQSQPLISAVSVRPAASAPASDPLRLDQFLISPAPDKTIERGLRALDHVIELHVENHYHAKRMQPSTSVRGDLERALADLGLGTEPSAPTLVQLVTLAVNPATRCTALRHVIASAMSQNVVLSATARFSLLPSSLCLFMAEIAQTEKDRGSPQAVSAALTRWRQMSAFLMHPSRSDRSTLVPTEAMVGDKVKRLAAALNKFLAAFVDPQISGQQQGHLHDLLMECAKFGYLLLSQPAEFCLRQGAKDQPGLGKGHLVVCPGLDKVRDEHGEAYSPPRTLLAPVTERV